MEYEEAAASGVLILKPKRFEDDRGFFSEVFNSKMSELLCVDFLQDNHSLSILTGTLRGLHFQMPPFEQGKLIRVVRGKIFDVAVDLREDSNTYLDYVGVELNRENWHQLWIPPGFAHGFLTLEPDTEVIYKVTKPYSKEHDAGIRWDDPAIAVAWPDIGRPPILSDKDRQLPFFSEIENPWPSAPARFDDEVG